MDFKILLNYLQDYLQYIHFFFISVIFGLASFFQKIKIKQTTKTFYNLFSELVFSLCAGYLAFRLSIYFEFKNDLIWIMVAIASYSGSKFLNFLEKLQEKLLSEKFKIEYTENKDNIDTKENILNEKLDDPMEKIDKLKKLKNKDVNKYN